MSRFRASLRSCPGCPPSASPHRHEPEYCALTWQERVSLYAPLPWLLFLPPLPLPLSLCQGTSLP
eukprot:5686936-Heterocapsa_arctica.AAC.1